MILRVQAIINRIVMMGMWKKWTFCVDTDSNGSYYFQIIFKEQCVRSGRTQTQHCRKWLLSNHMTDSEIIQTIYLAVEVATQHELRESFLLDGQPVFGPHFNVTKFAEILKEDSMRDARSAPVTHDDNKAASIIQSHKNIEAFMKATGNTIGSKPKWWDMDISMGDTSYNEWYIGPFKDAFKQPTLESNQFLVNIQEEYDLRKVENDRH